MKQTRRFRFVVSLALTSTILALLFVASPAAGAATWPMRQRDGCNTGRADFNVPASRLNTNFFGNIRWQKPSPGSPDEGDLGGSAMVFYDGAGPDGADLVIAGYHWPKGVQAMNRHTGAVLWSGNPGDGGECIGDNAPAFSLDGRTVYVVNDDAAGPMIAFRSADGPALYWDNSEDTDPDQLLGFSPRIAPDGRIFVASWDDQPYGATDSGTGIRVSWSASTTPCPCYSGPALWSGPDGLRVVSGGRCGMVKAWDGDGGGELWSVDIPGETDADATLDPMTGNTYVPVGFDSVWIVGLDKDGNSLWPEVAMPVFTWVDGVNHRQRAQSAGCLAADGLTYYFQTVSEQGDGRLYAIRTDDGSVKWSANTSSRGWEIVSSSPIVTENGVVIVGNNEGNTYFAILDADTNGVVLATLPVASGGNARASATLGPDGLLYLPVRMTWTASNGDGDIPSQAAANVFTAFDLNEEVTPKPDHWSQLALPETESRDRHTALGSDGTNVFFTLGAQADAPFHRIAIGSTNNGDWQAMTPLPLPTNLDYYNAGVGDLAYLNGALWTLAQRSASSGARCVYRYDLALNAWTKGNVTVGDGPNTACAPLTADRILGGYIGWDALFHYTVWQAGTSTQVGSLPGGPAHPWDACMGGGYAYFLKHRGSPSTNGVLLRVNQTGAIQTQEIAGLPFNPGMGCAIEFLPGAFFQDGHDRLWALRGGLGTGESDGAGWTQDATTDNVAVYDLVSGQWTVGDLGFPVDDGSEACLAGDTLYVLAANGETNPLRFMPLNDSSAPASCLLTIQSAYGVPLPSVGQHEYLVGQRVTCTVPATVEVGGVEYRCTGWQGTGSVGSGTGTSVTVTLGEDSELTWLWTTSECRLTVTPQGSGHTDVSSALFAGGATATITAYAAPGWQFAGWAGETNGGSVFANSMTVTMNQPRPLTAQFVRSSPITDATRFVSPTGSHSPPFDTWLTAATNIQSAVDAATAGETILVTNGTYVLASEVRLDKGVALRSVNGPGLTVLDGANHTRCLRLSHTNALVEGFTITRGWATNSGGGVFMSAGTVTHSVIASNGTALGHGGGIVTTQHCVIEYCHFLGNSATNGSGGGFAEDYSYISGQSSRIQNCIFAGNEAKTGGGVASSTTVTLRNSLVTGNRASQNAGGVAAHQVQMANCTIVENTGYTCGGVGVDWTGGSAIVNCIIDRNHVQHGIATNFSFAGAPLDHTYTVPFTGGLETCPDYADAEHGDFRLRPRSAGIDQGTSQSWMTNATDLDGHARVLDGQVDLGPWECTGDGFFCDLDELSQTTFINEPLVLQAVVFGPQTNGLSFAWDLNDDGNFEFTGSQFASITNTYSTPGTYAVSLRVSNAVGQVASIRRVSAVEVGARIIYVSPTGGNWPPYESWTLAARSVAAALTQARSGSAIWVTNGLYGLGEELRVLYGLTLRSVNGASNTFLVGSGTNRCLWIAHSNALVQGFTITNGFALGGDGGGVYLQNGSLSRCTVAANVSELYSAPPADDVGGYGGGVCVENGRVEDCLVYQNTGVVGGVALMGGLVDRSVIRDNYGYHVGGVGLYGPGTLRNSLIVSNTAPEASGFDLDLFAAGVGLKWRSSAILENSTVVGNALIPDPWGWGDGLVAVVNFGATVRNTIIADNDCTRQLQRDQNATNTFVCCTDQIPGPGSFQADPRFVNAAGGDYRLRDDSPCRNAGTNFAWMTGALDLTGRPRISEYWVDLGAYEYHPGQIVLTWTGPTDAYFHGTETLAWDTVTGRTQAMTMTLLASRLGASRTLGTDLERTGTLAWDTTPLDDGQYELRATLHDVAGGVLAESSRVIVVNNSVLGHSGTLSSSVIWSNDSVHLIEGALTLAAGQTLTILPGTIVKCVPGARVILQDGAHLQAEGTPDTPIIFTSLADDAAGGDTNGDGDQTLPRPGDWLGFETQGGATVVLNNYAETRYLLLRHSDALVGDETWAGSSLHWITDDFVVPAGTTLTINAGAVVKFNPLKRLTVESGGTLRAEGTLTRPVLFTSIRDDSVSGDTNGDGDATSGSPGDWAGLHLNGLARLQHTILRFGAGGETADMPAMLKIASGEADVVLLNCRLEQGLLDAVSTWGGSTRLTNCVLASNGRGILVRENSTALLVNCTLYQHNWALVAHGGVSRCFNSIIANSAEFGVFGTPTEFADNNVWSPTGYGYPAGASGNVSVDPQFRNPDAGNFQLAYLSPMIDAADATRAPATDFMGAPRYDDPRTANTGVTNALGAVADLGAFEFVEGAESDLDLVAQNVVGPSAATAGNTVTVTWQIRNQGGGVVAGQWHDRISLVPETSDGWNESLLVADVLSSATLGPGAVSNVMATVRVPGGTEGNWRWQVKANALGDIFEGLNWNNNLSELSAPLALTVPVLSVGEAVQTMFTGQNQPACYKLTNAVLDTLITLDSAMFQGRVRLYAGLGRMPTEEHFDRRSDAGNLPDASLALPRSPANATVYLMAMPESLPYAPAVYALSAQARAFGIVAVAPTVVGNAGEATLEITGYGFTTNTQVKLRPAGAGAERSVARWLLADSTRGYATFDLNGAATGSYDLRLLQATQEAVQSNGVFMVTSGETGGGEFRARLSVPTAVRAGRVFRGYVHYQNVGTSDVPAPLLVLEADVRTTLFPAGMPEMAKRRLHFLAAAQGRPQPSVLSPGTQYTFAFQGVSEGNDAISIRLFRADAGASEPMDYAALKADIAPDNPHVLFNPAYTEMTNTLGATQGSYVSAVGQAADRAAAYGETSATAQSLLTHLIRESVEGVQDATVSGVARLGDASHPLGRVQVFLTPQNRADTNLFGTTTWYDGTFGIRDVPPGTYWVSVQHYLPPQITQVTLTEAKRRVTGLTVIAREPAAEIAGTIMDRFSGAPITNATLRARGLFGGTIGFGATDTNGAYRIRDLYAGHYTLEISAPGTLPDPVASVGVESGRTTYRSFALSRLGAVIRGYVRKTGGAPVGDALVSAEWLDYTEAYGTWRSAQAYSAADGSYAITALPPGRYGVTASLNTAGVSDKQIVQLAGADDAASANLLLHDDVTFTGTVIDAGNGAPVTNARISVAVSPAWETSFATDASGHFTIPNLTLGDWVLNAWADGYVLGKTNLPVTTPGSHSVALPLLPKGEVTVRVKNAGTALQGAVVSVLPWASDSVQYLITDETGERKLANIPPGQYSVVLGGKEGLSYGRQDFEITPTSRSHSFSFNPTLARIVGRVLTPNGTTGVTNAMVYLLRQGEVIGSVQTDAEGDYIFALFEPGTFDLLAMGPDFCVASLTNVVVTNADSVVTRDFIQPTNTLAVQVTDVASGQPLANACVELRPVAGQDRKVQAPLQYTDTAGRSRFSAVAAGDYQLWVHADDHALYRQTLRMTNGLGQANVTLAAGRRVYGQVTSNQVGLAFVRVDLAMTNGPVLVSALTDTNGNYELTSVPTGVFDVVARPNGTKGCAAMIRAAVNLLSVTERREDFSLASDITTTVSGFVADGNGRRVTEAVVVVLHGDGCAVAATVTDAQGEFTLRHCPAGSFRLNAGALGYAGTNRPLALVGGQSVSGLELRLSRPISANGAITDGDQLDIQGQGRGPKDWDLGVVDYFTDLYSNQKWGDLATSSFWNDVLSGSMGLTDPSLAYENSDIDLNRDVIAPFEQAKADGKVDCVLEAYEDALNRYKNLHRALAGWNDSYQAAKKLNQADVNLVIARASLIAAKLAKLLGDFAGGPSGGSFGGLSPELSESLVGVADNGLGWAAAFQQANATGEFGNLGGWFQGMGSVSALGDLTGSGVKTYGFNSLAKPCQDLGHIQVPLESGLGGLLPADFMDTVKSSHSGIDSAYAPVGKGNLIKEGADYLGKAADSVDVLLEIQSLFQELEGMDQDVLNTTGNYLDAQHTYCKALKDYHNASRRLIALGKDCKTSDGTEAEPPDDPMGDEVDKADVVKPFELDPNDKITTGTGDFGFIQALDRIYYTIHFENVRTASAPAQLVVVTDQLHPSLDEKTFELGEIGFNNVVVWTPAGLTRFDSTTNVATDPNPVRIHAELDPATRAVTWTLQSVDRVTGDYPEDPWAGFLPPNTTNHIGDGYVTFSVLPKTNAGVALITNRAVIVFGVNAPIATPVVTNLVDQTPPVSAVNPLPAYTATASFLVSWSGTDAGAGIAGYDIYVSSNGGPWRLWLANTPLTAATFPGRVKTTYGFYSVATDRVVNIEAAPAVADATTTTADNQAPVLAPISDGLVRVNESLCFTNQASDPDGDALRFSLGAAPTGVSVTPDTGILRWTPTCAQGSTTNLIEVRVTDNGTPPMSASQSFHVIVPECIEAGLGNTIMQVGTTSSVPVRLLSTVALTNLTFTVLYPAERLTNFAISPNSPQVLTQQLRMVSPGCLEVSFTLPGSSVLHGPTNAANLAFVTPTNQTSAFVPLLIENVDGWRPDGGLAANASGQPGRVVVIGREPLLEGVSGADGKPHVLLYGNPGVSYQLERRTNVVSGSWQPLGSMLMTNLWRDAHTGEVSHPTMFFRAY